MDEMWAALLDGSGGDSSVEKMVYSKAALMVGWMACLMAAQMVGWMAWWMVVL